MPFLPISVPLFPDIPNVPGVPFLARSLVNTLPLPLVSIIDSIGLSTLIAPRWGIFSADGLVALTGDSVEGVDFRHDFRMSDYPIERGGFETYNKVATPFECRVTIIVGSAFTIRSAVSAISNLADAAEAGSLDGSSLGGALRSLSGESKRSELLRQIDIGINSLTMFNVVTPEVTYNNVNIVNYSYRRGSRGGSTMLKIDLSLEQVRIAPNPAFTSTQSASGASTTNTGDVQTGNVAAISAGPVTSTPLPPPT